MSSSLALRTQLESLRARGLLSLEAMVAELEKLEPEKDDDVAETCRVRRARRVEECETCGRLRRRLCYWWIDFLEISWSFGGVGLETVSRNLTLTPRKDVPGATWGLLARGIAGGSDMNCGPMS